MSFCVLRWLFCQQSPYPAEKPGFGQVWAVEKADFVHFGLLTRPAG